MRISTFKGDKGFKSSMKQWEVSFNGKPVAICDVMLADEEQSLLVTYKRRLGVIVRADGDPITLIERGTVKIWERENSVVALPEEVPFG